MPARRFLLAVLLVLAGATHLGADAHAQFATPSTSFLQLGGAGTPGVGVQAGFVTPSLTVFTREAAFYADYAPRFIGDDGRLLVGLGLGGSVRVLRVLTILADYDASRYDLDAGFRFGPSFFFSFFETTAASKARSFRLFTELFARGAIRFANGRAAYVELGTHPSHLRVGLVVGL